MTPEKKKIYTTVYLLWLFLGIFGAHRFYMQYYVSGTVYLLTLGFVSLGWLLDVGLIPSLIDEWEVKKNGGDIMSLPVEETPVSPYLVSEDPQYGTYAPIASPVSPVQTPEEPKPTVVVPTPQPVLPVAKQEYKPTNVGVKHVILVALRGKSFDQMLGGLQQELHIDGADAKRNNFGSSGVPIFQAPISTKFNENEFYDSHEATMKQMGDTKEMNHFIETTQKMDERTGAPFYAGRFEEIMGFYSAGSLPSLHTLARHFTVCDKWFSSVPGSSWANRSFLFSGTSQGRVQVPDDEEQFSPTQPTLFDRLDEAEVTWNVYHDGFASSLVFPGQWNEDKISKYKTMDKFYKDCKLPANHFPEFVLIEPKIGCDANDSSAPHNVMNGEKLLSDVYNAVRGNDDLWYSSLIVVLFDQHGGVYDHVSPPDTVVPDEHTEEFTFDTLGVRVPAILVSPYVQKGVDSTVYDHTSLLSYISSKWGLGTLGDRTASADSFDSKIIKTARKDCPTKLDHVNHDGTIRSGNPSKPFTSFQKEIISVMKSLAETRPSLGPLTGDFANWSEFETGFAQILGEHQ